MKHTQQALRQLGIHGTYKGYYYLASTLELLMEAPDYLPLYSKIIFPAVARAYETTPSRVERNIRTVIEHCWNGPGKEKLEEIAPYRLYKQPSTSDFIDIVYWYIKFLEEQSLHN